MRAGKLSTLVRIEECTETRDPHGQPIKTWTTLLNRWGDWEQLEGRELVSSRQIHAEVTHRFTMRGEYLPRALTTKDRLWYRERAFDIAAILELAPKRSELQILTIERLH